MNRPIGESETGVDQHAELKGVRIFVVEDEALVLMDLEDMLSEMGCIVIGPAMKVAAAQEIVASDQPIDVAMLDVNVAGDLIFPVAELLKARNVPMMFASGYGSASLDVEWQTYPLIQKPYGFDDLARALTLTLSKAAGA